MPGRAGSWIAAGDRLAGERGSRFCRAPRQTGARSAHLALGKIGGTARPRRGPSRHGRMDDPKRRSFSPAGLTGAAAPHGVDFRVVLTGTKRPPAEDGRNAAPRPPLCRSTNRLSGGCDDGRSLPRDVRMAEGCEIGPRLSR